MTRDLPDAEYHDFAKVVEGGVCPHCGKHSVTISRGIEVGNIFQLGTKYTKAMNMTYLDSEGKTQNPIMGCYGIGVGRLAASVCEAHHDAYGPIWPMSIAPWQVHICAMRADNAEVRAFADSLYDTLRQCRCYVLGCGSPWCAGSRHRQPPQHEGRLLRDRNARQEHFDESSVRRSGGKGSRTCCRTAR